MKTAQEPTSNGQVVQETRTRRIFPASELPENQTRPDFWEYVEKMTPEDWEHHILYIYRRQGENVPALHCGKFTGFIPMPDGPVPVSDREEFELAVQKKFGGGSYRLLLKKGKERRFEGRLLIEGPPKRVEDIDPDLTETPGTLIPRIAYPGQQDATADVAKTAMGMLSSKESELTNVAVGALKGAADVITKLSAQGVGQQMNPLQDAIIARLMQPSDPIGEMTKILGMFEMLQRLTGNGSGPAGKIVEMALDRFANPVATGPATSASAELVRTLPQIAGYASEIVKEWRLGTEAQAKTAEYMVQAGIPPNALPPGTPQTMPTVAPAGQIMRPNPQIATNVASATPATNATPANGANPAMSGPSLEFIESKIIEILNEPENSPSEAADETVQFLLRIHPALVARLLELKEQGVLALFQSRPTLQPALQNLAKLQEFIKFFFKYAKDPGNDGAVVPPGAVPSAKPN